MSIIERALQKAQQQGRSKAVEQHQSAVDQPPTVVAGQPPAVGISPAPAKTDLIAPPFVSRESSNVSRAEEDVAAASLTSRDVKRIVEFNHDRLREAGRLPPTHAMHQTDEDMRRIKWPLLAAIAGRG